MRPCIQPELCSSQSTAKSTLNLATVTHCIVDYAYIVMVHVSGTRMVIDKNQLGK